MKRLKILGARFCRYLGDSESSREQNVGFGRNLMKAMTIIIVYLAIAFAVVLLAAGYVAIQRIPTTPSPDGVRAPTPVSTPRTI